MRGEKMIGYRLVDLSIPNLIAACIGSGLRVSVSLIKSYPWAIMQTRETEILLIRIFLWQIKLARRGKLRQISYCHILKKDAETIAYLSGMEASFVSGVKGLEWNKDQIGYQLALERFLIPAD